MSASSLKSYAVVISEGKAKLLESDYFVDIHKGFFMIVNGFGGTDKPDAAYSKAKEMICSFLQNANSDSNFTMPYRIRNYNTMTGNLLLNAICVANKFIYELNQKLDFPEKTGASILLAKLEGDILTFASVGNICAHKIYGNNVKEIASADCFSKVNGDDSYIPLNALGYYSEIEPKIFEAKIRQGDCFVLSNAGVYNFLNNDDYLSTIHQNLEDKKILNSLIDKSIKSGSISNLIGILLRF